MASEPTAQQLITLFAKATADTIASALTARTASISLPIYDLDSKDAYHSFSIFQHTLENWLLLNCIPLDSEDHLRYVFAALRTKSLEMHAQWMPTGSEEEQKVNSSQPAEQTALHVIPIAPNATRWDTEDQNAVVASHSNQGMHPHLGHSRGSPDAHLGITITTVGRITKQMP